MALFIEFIDDMDKTSKQLHKEKKKPKIIEKPTYEINKIRITTTSNLIPFFSPKEEIESLLNSPIKVLRPLAGREDQILLCKILQTQYSYELLIDLFWLVFTIKYPQCFQISIEDFQMQIRDSISKNYIDLFSNMSKKKDEVITCFMFIVSYLVHTIFYFNFPQQRDDFSNRFFYDCIHIAVSEMNGVIITDIFIERTIEKYFYSTIMDYFHKGKFKQKSLKEQQPESEKIETTSFLAKYTKNNPLTYEQKKDAPFELQEKLNKLREIAKTKKEVNPHLAYLDTPSHYDTDSE